MPHQTIPDPARAGSAGRWAAWAAALGRFLASASGRRRRPGFSDLPLDACFEAVTEGLVTLVPGSDNKLRYQHVNAAAARLLGQAPEALRDRRPADSPAAEPMALIEAQLEACLRTGQIKQVCRGTTVAGQARILDITVSALRPSPAGPQGAPGGVLVRLSDVTELRSLQLLMDERTQAMRRSMDSQAALFQTIQDGLAIVLIESNEAGDVEGFCFQSVNPACARITGVALTELVGHRVCNALPAPLGAMLERDYALGLHSGSPIRRAATYNLPSGRRDLETVAVPLANPVTGRIDRLLTCLHDLTERHDLADQLRQSQKLEAVGRIAAGVAHDFNNILQGLIGSLEMVADHMEPGAEMERHLRMAMTAADRGADLTHQLLAHARKQSLQPRMVALGPLLEELRDMLSRAVGPLVRMEYDIRTPDIRISLDVTQFTTAMLNLGVNAAHAMPQGGVLKIECALQDVPAGGDLVPRAYAVIAVTDTGVGMDADTQARAFEPFYSTKGTRGTGLGLAMVQGFSQQSGGRTRLHSTQGVGTRIEIWLPRADGGEVEPTHRRHEDGPVLPKGRGGRILLVDDMSDVLITAGAFLEAAGLSVTRCSSAEIAIERLDRETFDVLVTDFAMPGLHGLALIERARLRRPGLPAILITGYPGVGERPDGPVPAVVLAKPFRRAELLAAVAALLYPITVEATPSSPASA